MGLARRSLKPWPVGSPRAARAAARKCIRPQFAENEFLGIQSAQARGEKAGAEAFQARAQENHGGVADYASTEE